MSRRGCRFEACALGVAWALVLLTAASKAISWCGTSLALETVDPVTGLKLRHVMAAGAVAEAVVCVILAVARSNVARGIVLLTVGGEFALYHVTQRLMAYGGPCPCLGAVWLGRWFEFSARQLTTAAEGITAILLASGLILVVAGVPQAGRLGRQAA